MATNTYEIAKALRRARNEVQRITPELGQKILGEFKLVVSDPYPPPSSPGEPPHLRTGAYRNGIKVKAKGGKITVYTTGFANNVGTWTEFGTRKMAARPHWRTRLPPIIETHVPPAVAEAILRGEAR